MSKPETYPLTELEENFYQFYSDAGNLYHIYFKFNFQNDVVQLYSDNRDIEVYEFFFEIISVNAVSSFDNKITNTLLQTLEDFLKVAPYRILFYITNRDDERNYALFRIYEIWFRKYKKETDTRMLKYNRVIMQDDYVEAYLSCLYLDTDFTPEYLNRCLDTCLAEIYPNYKVLTE